MPVSEQIRITRDKLADFVPDHDTIRQLEILIALVNTLKLNVDESFDEGVRRVLVEEGLIPPP